MVDRLFDTIDFGTAAKILCYTHSGISSYFPPFLISHIEKWQKGSVESRFWLRNLNVKVHGWESLDEFHGHSGMIIHHMRSFVVAYRHGMMRSQSPPTPGLKCHREHVTFQGFYDDGDSTPIKLIENRYSTTVTVHPLQRPAGNFVLVSICDGDYLISHFKELSRDINNQDDRWPSWKNTGILLAGLYTGVSMFQLQICDIIDSWEQDWKQTIKRIDEKVILKVRSSRIHYPLSNKLRIQAGRPRRWWTS